jgi:hypothetical protein
MSWKDSLRKRKQKKDLPMFASVSHASVNVFETILYPQSIVAPLVPWLQLNNTLSLMQQMAKMRQPLNVSEGLSLANSLVEGTEWENKIVEFKSKRGWKPFAEDGSKNPILGAAWYNGFWKCHGHEIEKKKGQKFSKD